MIGRILSPVLRCAAIIALLIAACSREQTSFRTAVQRHHAAIRPFPEEEELLRHFDAESATRDRSVELLSDTVLTLEGARKFANRDNPDIHAAQARLQNALARILEARSRYWPTVSFSHNSTRTFHTPASRNRLSTLLQPAPNVPVDIDSNTFAITTLINALRRPLFGYGRLTGDTNSFSEHSTALSATWTIFDGFVREAALMAGKELAHAAGYSLSDVRRIVTRAVDAAYYQVQLAEERLRIARADESFSREQLTETEKLRAAGRATAADVDNFTVRVLAAQGDVTAAEGMHQTGRVVLAEVMGLPDSALPPAVTLSILSEESSEEMQTVDVSMMLERALRDRPDLAQMEHLVRSEQENIRAAKGAYLPILAASGSWGFDRGGNVHYDVDDQSSAAGIEFRWDLFTAGARKARVMQAVADRAAAAANLQHLKLAVQSEVRQAAIDVTSAQQQITIHRSAVETARENRRIVQAGYIGGKETLNRLNEAQRDFIAAEADLALARIRLRQAWSDLHAAVGEPRPVD